MHTGFELINHPLGASLRMFFSPYRSIIVRGEYKKKQITFMQKQLKTVLQITKTYEC